MLEKGQRAGTIVDAILLPFKDQMTRGLYLQIWDALYARILGLLA